MSQIIQQTGIQLIEKYKLSMKDEKSDRHETFSFLRVELFLTSHKNFHYTQYVATKIKMVKVCIK